jgi:hypothetical protein
MRLAEDGGGLREFWIGLYASTIRMTSALLGMASGPDPPVTVLEGKQTRQK